MSSEELTFLRDEGEEQATACQFCLLFMYTASVMFDYYGNFRAKGH